MKSQLLNTLCMVIFCTVMTVDRAQGNLLMNGDFEAGNTGFSTDYNYVASHSEMPEGYYGITSYPKELHWATLTTHVDHTTGSGRMMMVNGARYSSSLVWAESISVIPNETYEFSMWVSRWASESLTPGTLAVYVNGDQIGSNYTTLSTRAVWDEFNAEWLSGTAMHADIEMRILSAHSLGNDFAFDDLYFDAIPEPTSAVFIVLSGCAALWIRRWFIA